MALSGTLETFSLPDVLRLLASTKKTGLLALDGDRGTGRLWVDAGELVGGDAERSVVDDVDAVLFELLRFATASFEFDATATPPSVDVRRDVEEALEVAGARLEEWREIEAVVPSLDVRVRMAPEVAGDVEIDPDVWRLLACVGAGASGHDVARHLAQGEYDVCGALRDLVERELVEIEVVEAVEPSTDVADAAVDRSADVADAFAAMVAAPEPAPVPVYEVPSEPTVEEPAVAPEPVVDEAPALDHDGVDADEASADDAPLSDLALLSPKAAAAVEATWADDDPADDASEAEEPTAEAPNGEAEGDEVDQNLLLRFLSSTKP